MPVSSDAGLKDFRTARPWSFSRVELQNSMRCSVVVSLAGHWSNCAALLPPGERVWLFHCSLRPRNARRRVRSSMFRIPSTRFLLRLREWNFRDCFGFDAEKMATDDRSSKRPRTLLLRTKK